MAVCMHYKPKAPERNTFRWATTVYALALILVGTVAVSTHVMLARMVNEQKEVGHVVNLSGRQRMLSQRIAKLSLELVVRRADEVTNPLLPKLREAINQLYAAHDSLTRGEFARLMSRKLNYIYYQKPHELNRQINDYLIMAEIVYGSAEKEKLQLHDPMLLRLENASRDTLLNALDAATSQYQADAEENVDEMLKTMRMLLAALILLLVFEAFFVFRPLFRSMAKMQRELLDTARYDPLTGCMNRRYFVENSSEEFARIKKNNWRASVLFFDIDYFKAINDQYGHAIGDRALQHFTHIILQHLRFDDVFGRLGGEEFALFAPGMSLDDAVKYAEKLRLLIVADPIEVEPENWLVLNASIGVTEVLLEDVTLFDALNRADRAMYQAKQQGRGRVVAG